MSIMFVEEYSMNENGQFFYDDDCLFVYSKKVMKKKQQKCINYRRVKDLKKNKTKKTQTF